MYANSTVPSTFQASLGSLRRCGDLDRCPPLFCTVQSTSGWGSPHLLQTCRRLHHTALHWALLKSWHTSADPRCPVRAGFLVYGGAQSYRGADTITLPPSSPLEGPAIGSDRSGHSTSMWFSLRHDWHRRITRARPVNASLYRAESMFAQRRLFVAAARRR